MSVPIIILAAALLEGITQPIRHRPHRVKAKRYTPRLYS